MATIGVITEQNDLGLGFDPLNGNDQMTYEQAQQNNDQQSDKDADNKQIKLNLEGYCDGKGYALFKQPQGCG